VNDLRCIHEEEELKKKQLWLLTVLLSLALVLSACTTAATGDNENEAAENEAAENEVAENEAAENEAAENEAAENEAAPEGGDFTFVLVTPNTRGDLSFVDASVRGVDRANEEFGLSGTIIETTSVAEQEAAIQAALTQGNDLILALAPDAEVLLSIAEENPDQRFGVPSDIFVESLPDNVQAYQINVHEGSFLAGVVAGMMTETKIVGAVVGGDGPGLNQFYWAYKQGVRAVCPDCRVLVGYLNFVFDNPTLGREAAQAQYDQGADIIFQVAGRSGEGVIEAAEATGNFAIGVDSNQDDVAPGSVIVSMIKRVDTSTYLLIRDTMQGNFQGGFQQIGMADGATGLSWDDGSTTFADNGPEEMTAKLAEVQAAVEDYRQQILDGSLVVCDALNAGDAPECEGLAGSD
jgi:basic membrane protein A